MKFYSYRPVQILTFAIDHSIWGLDARGYHLTNTLLHILAALCIYWFINILYRDNLLSLFASVLFVTHPIHTSAIAYISGRAEPLEVIFMIFSFIFYIKYLDLRRPIFSIFMLLSYIMALLSNEGSLILPALLLLYHYAFKKKIEIKGFLPILGITLAYLLLRLTAFKSLSPHVLSSTAILQRLPGFFIAVVNYIRLLLLPFHLHMEYGYKHFNIVNPMALLGIVTSCALLFYAFRKRDSGRVAFFSLCWFFTALLPKSNIYPIAVYMAEHWLYLPSIGFFLLLARGINSVYKIERFRTAALVFLISLLFFVLI